MINNRKNDSIVEREVAAFIDEHLYSDSEFVKSYNRTDTVNEQIKGSDVLLSTTDGRLNNAVVDEKVAATQANKWLKTFALELSFINRRGERMCGWFIDTSKTTEYYLLGWINKADIPYDNEKRKWNTDLIRRDNIRELEWALVSRKRLYDFLKERKWTLDRLGRQDAKIRQNGSVKTMEFIDDVTFRYSPQFIEKPINILLKRETYISISDYHGIIYN